MTTGYIHQAPFRIELDRIVSIGGIAEKIGVARSTAANYPSRYEDFPQPLDTPGAIGTKLYDWKEVEAWYEATFAERNPRGFGQSITAAPTERNES